MNFNWHNYPCVQMTEDRSAMFLGIAQKARVGLFVRIIAFMNKS